MPIETINSFAQLALAPAILQAVDEVGYELPSPIQAESIPPLLLGRDLLGQAQTGTGKTAAFALPLLSRLDLSQTQPQILVLTPTRELAIQVAEAMQTYARHLKGFHILPVYGGQGMSSQLRQLKRGVHVVVGTPGRILDHLRRGTLVLSQVKSVVLDEADEMLRMGFIDDVEEILKHTPSSRQVALFSATMPSVIRQVAHRHLRDPVEIHIKTKTTTVASINQRYWQVTGVHKLDALTRMLEIEDFDAMLIFVRTKTSTVELSEKLEARGHASAPLNGDMNQALREKTIEGLRNGTIDIVIATDVAARGLDVERISHVINYDIPTDTEAYVHRIGRTGRAGRKGEAILFVSPRERRMLHAIERATHQNITSMKLPSHADVVDRRIAQFKQQLNETLEAQDLDFFTDLISQYQEEFDVSLEEICAGLAFLVQRERPLLLPATPETSYSGADDFDNSRGNNSRRGSRHGDDVGSQPEPGMIRYRIEVGRTHGVQPKHIVGAIANEANLDSQYIGHIKLFDHFSTVDLPSDLPVELFQHLQKVWVCGQQLQISVDNKPGGNNTDRGRPPRRAPSSRGDYRSDSRESSPRDSRESSPRDSRERGSNETRSRYRR